MSLKKFLPMLAIISMMNTATAFEYGRTDNSNCATSVCDPCYADACCSENGSGLYIDYLYWAARKCDLDYAIPYSDAIDPVSIGEVYQINPSWDSGFRIGLSKDCTPFIIGAVFTWYHPTAHSSIINTDGFLGGTYIIDEFNEVEQGEFQLARADWNLVYNTLDLLVGYEFCTTPCVNASVYGGFKAAFLNQHFNVLYSEEIDPAAPGNGFDLINMSNQLNGYGLDLGVKASYAISQCFEAFGSASLDLLAGHFKRHFKYVTSDDGGVTETISADLRDSCIRSVGVCNLQLGLTYRKCVCNFDTSLSIGYEFHNWFNVSNFLINQNESGQITIDDALDCYGFDGLFVRLGIGF